MTGSSHARSTCSGHWGRLERALARALGRPGSTCRTLLEGTLFGRQRGVPLLEHDFGPADAPRSKAQAMALRLDQPAPMHPDEQAGLDPVGELPDRTTHQVQIPGVCEMATYSSALLTEIDRASTGTRPGPAELRSQNSVSNAGFSCVRLGWRADCAGSAGARRRAARHPLPEVTLDPRQGAHQPVALDRLQQIIGNRAVKGLSRRIDRMQ